MKGTNMKSMRKGEKSEDRAMTWQTTGGRSPGGVGDSRRTEIKIKSRIKIKRWEAQAGWGEAKRLREKNVANMAHKKKTLEITGLFCRVLVCHLAHKERRCEVRGRTENCKSQN
jgi:hypothetical protein